MGRGVVMGWLALLAPALVAVVPAHAAPKANQVSVSLGASDGSTSTRSTWIHAWNGNLSKDGFLSRFDAAFTGLSLDSSDLGIARGDLLVGYQWHTDALRLRLMGGASIVNREFSNPGPTAIAGTFAGFKVSGQISTNSASKLLLSATGAYSTVLRQYSTSFQAGWKFAGFNAGIEGGFGGSDTYKGEKVGVFLSGIKIGLISLSSSVGYSFGGDEEQSKNSPYADLSASLQF